MQDRLSVRLKVYSTIASVLCIIVLGVGVSVLLSRRYIRKTIEEGLLSVCEIANESLSEQAAFLKKETDALAARLENYSDEELQEILPKAARDGGWKGLSVVKRDGSMITFGLKPKMDDLGVKAVFDGQTVTSGLEFSADADGLLISTYAPVGDGVLAASLSSLSLIGFAKSYQRRNTDIFVIDNKGGVAAVAPPLLAILDYDPDGAFFQRIINSDGGVYVHAGVIYAFHRIEDSNDWKLGVAYSLNGSPVWRIQRILTLYGLGLLAFGALAAVLIGGSVVHRIERKRGKEINDSVAQAADVASLSAEEEKLIKQLKEIEGLDVENAIRMLGKREGYYQILQQFCASVDESIRILKIAAKGGDWKAWAIRIHSLKSVLRTIGMNALGEEAARLEEAGNAEDAFKCRESMTAFCASLKGLQKRLCDTDLFPTKPETDANRIGLEALRDKLNVLKNACSGYNVKEIGTRLADIRNVSFNKTTDKGLRIVCNLIDFFDYDEAIDKIDELLDSLEASQVAENERPVDKEFSILAIDDEEVNLTTLQVILGMEYTLFTACSGVDALRQLDGRLPDLILLDILLPDMSGFELLEKLKSNPVFAQIPVIIVTGLSGEKEEERGFFLGAVDYITKPFNNAIVRVRVKTHLRMISHIRAIERLGMVDPLTNIANRRSFDEHMRIEWKRSLRDGGSIAFLMMDIDKFKNYNDTYGHPQGDALLKAVSRTIETSILRAADIVARLGGEEFGVILPDASLKDSLVVAERIRSTVEDLQVPTADGFITRVTISIGVVSITPTQETTIEDIILQADKNLYRAKEDGRNRVFWGEA
jgi:diguanylate cyclase (GGDEF)-like protein